MTKRKKDPKLPHLINLVLGDWSRDGHSVSETVTISSNLDRAAVSKAYKAGAKKLGLDLSNEVAADYEDGCIDREQWEIFASAGLTLEDAFDDDECLYEEAKESLDKGRKRFGISEDSFVRIWLFVVKHGNPSFEHRFNEDDSTDINIGGYGLYS